MPFAVQKPYTDGLRTRSKVPLTTKYSEKPLKHAVRDIVRAHCKQHTAVGACDGNDWHPWRDVIDDQELAILFDTPGKSKSIRLFNSIPLLFPVPAPFQIPPVFGLCKLCCLLCRTSCTDSLPIGM